MMQKEYEARSFVESLGDALLWLPVDLQEEVETMVSPESASSSETSFFLNVITMIKEAELDQAISAIDDGYELSAFKAELFLLRARVEFLRSDYSAMNRCLDCAQELGIERSLLISTCDELKGLLLQRTSQNVPDEDQTSKTSLKSDSRCKNSDEVQRAALPLGRNKLSQATSAYRRSALDSALTVSQMQELMEIKIINLAHRDDRWIEIKGHLDQLGFLNIDNCRFEAIHLAGFGELGCTRSHLLAMTEFLCKSEKPYLMILEDDFRFKAGQGEIVKILHWFIDKSRGDVLMMNCSCAMLVPDEDFEGEYTVNRVLSSNSMAGFVIKRGHVRELIGVLLDSLRSHESLGPIYQNLKSQGRREAFRPILNMICNDRVWVNLQTSHRYLTLTPSIGSTAESYSDIESRTVNYRRMEVQ